MAYTAYVDSNPVRAGMAEKPEASEYTSIGERILAFAAQSRRRGRPPKVELASGQSAPATSLGAEQEAQRQPSPRFPFAGFERADRPKGISFRFADYLDLLDWIGRAVREDKRGAIPSHLPPILERLGFRPEQ